jgi:hypothetical protein
MIEKKIYLVQPGCMDRGVDHDRVRVRPGEPVDRGLAAVVRAVVHDDEHAGRVLVLRLGRDLPDQLHERDDSHDLRGGGEHFAGADVEAGEQGEGTVAGVLVLHDALLAQWITDARAADLPHVHSFARRLDLDIQAATAALTLRTTTAAPKEPTL